ncbi:MAG: LytR/AlgR family response regulator transcription factor [Flavobacteriales bacterium]|jgi:two-component system LytT family response regulator
MVKYKLAIVDDEERQRAHLLTLLKEYFPHYEVVGVFTGVDEALIQLPKVNPDLVMLDVQMPPKTGFDLLRALPNTFKFSVIFTTSYAEYALQAIKVAAVDYLLKPYGLAELKEALSLFEKKHSENIPNLQLMNLMQNLSEQRSGQHKIGLPTQAGFIFIRIDEIVRCESDNTYTTLFLLGKKSIVISRTIKEVEEILESYNFFRIHQSHLINMAYIREFKKGEGTITMDDGSVLDISRRKKDDFMDRLTKV